ncbi:hypothetical protein DY000_02058146 [Brassica cretica]|uniref:Uncharacterized protein n=1 Tax=Brassica cretica TaxID=69181 RepID=A0ABQ7AFY6_BRACR|nr:hypothetical protein DY000_02058146 [Brassica cretica]
MHGGEINSEDDWLASDITESLSVDVQIRLLRSCNAPRGRYVLFWFHVRFIINKRSSSSKNAIRSRTYRDILLNKNSVWFRLLIALDMSRVACSLSPHWIRLLISSCRLLW